MKKIFTLFMLCAVCALGAAAQELLPLVGNWRFTTAGTASSDGNVYSGDVTLTGQWGDMGGAAWAGEVGTGGKHTITIKVSEPLPEGFQWKVNYVDATDDNAQYVPFDAGQTEVSFVFDKTYTFLSLQWTKSESVTIHVIGVERTREGEAPKLKSPELSFSPASVRIQPGEAFSAPVLSNPHALPVAYSSASNPEGFVAVDAQTGAVTLAEGEGTAKVTASFDGNEEYEAGSASYTITVRQKVEGGIPLVYEVENTGADASPIFPKRDEAKKIDPLPDPLEWSDGSGRVTDFSDWAQRRGEIAKEIQHYEIGTKPTVDPSAVKASMDGNTLNVEVTVNGQTLKLSATINYPNNGEAPYALMIGTSGISLPSAVYSSRPIATMTFSESQVNNYSQFGSPAGRGNYAFDKLYPDLKNNGAYSEWAWGLSRLLDGLQQLGPEVTKIDMSRIGVTGCSYAGKMALFCGAFDERVALTIAQEPGGGGAAAWRYSRWLNAQPNAESVEGLDNTDYNWFMQSLRDTYNGKNVSYLPHDHHELAAMVCPRALLMLGNPDYVWLADPSAYVSMNGAMKVWEQFGIEDRVGYSIVAGHGHCSLPQSQYPEVEAYIDKFLLGKEDANTTVRIAPSGYSQIDLDWWIGWWGNSAPGEFGADPVVYQGPDPGTETLLPLTSNWASRVDGTPAQDGKIYAGTVNFTGQWGEVGGRDWGADVTEGTKHVITVHTAKPAPDGIQWKLGYKDEYGEPIGETYPAIEVEGNTIKITLTQSYWYLAVQRKSSSAIDPLEILSVTRDVYMTEFNPSSEDLEILVDHGAEIEGKQSSPNGLPATVSLPGNWGDVKLWGEPFSINDYPRYRIELGKAPGAEGQLQMFLRNQAQATAYGGHYYPFAADQTVLEGTFNPADLEDDLTVVQFALQNMTGNSVETIVNDVVLYTPEGEEKHTAGLVANGWNPATITEFGAGPVYQGTVNFPQQYAYVGPYSGEVAVGTYHHYTFYTDAPIPEGFQMVTVIGEDVQTTPIVASDNEFSFDVFSDYSFLALQYINQATSSVHFNRITRQVLAIDPTTIENMDADAAAQVIATKVYTVAGQPAGQLSRGINILRETLSNGTVRTRKVIIR